RYWGDIYGEIEGLAPVIRLFFERALYVGLKPYDNEGRILPIIADLTTTDETAWVRYIETSKARTKKGTCNSKWGDVEVGFNMAEACTEIHASVPTCPVRRARVRAAVPSSAYQPQKRAF